MRKRLRFLAYVLVPLALIVIGILAVGAALPVDHVAVVSAVYQEPPDVVWEAITNYEAFPEWRTGVSSVAARTFADGSSGWVEEGDNGTIPMAVDESDPPRRAVMRIATEALPFGGSWTYELVPEGGGTRLTLTENGQVTNVLFRFVSRFVMGHTFTMETYLVDLGARYGEQIAPQVIGR